MQVANAERVLSEYQHLAVGDALDRAGNMRVKAIARDKALVLGPPDDLEWGASTWAIALYPLDEERTRLVSRVRARLDRGTPQGIFWLLLLDPGQLLMEREWLRGVKERAERAAGHSARTGVVPPIPLARAS
jgi:hypothetical protein